MKTHNYGIGGKSSTFNVTRESLQGNQGVATCLGEADGGDIYRSSDKIF